jgi:hypothetical protein
MRARMARLCVCLLPLLGSGCMSRQLERSTYRTLNTLPDLYYQQLMNNLAAIAAVPGRLPGLAVVGQGSVQVTGNGTFGVSSAGKWAPAVSVTVNTTETFGLGTVTSPDKIRQMQAVYQRAVSLKVQQDPS